MAKCKNCKRYDRKAKWCDMIGDSTDEDFERYCGAYEKMTNADRIHSMSIEELAEFLCEVKADYQWIDQQYPSEEEAGEWEEWLQSEVEVRE